MNPSPMTADDIEAAGGDVKARDLASAASGPALDLQGTGYRTVYDVGTFSPAASINGVPNPDFTASPAGVVVMPAASSPTSTIPNWWGEGFPTAGTDFASTWAELVDYAGKRFLKIDQSAADIAGVQARLRTTVAIPAALIGHDVELSFLVGGYLPESMLFGGGWGQTFKLDVGLDPTTGLRRVSCIVPAIFVTSPTHSLNIYRTGTKAAGKFFLLGEVMVTEAVARPVTADVGLPRTGTNIQFCRIEGVPTEAQMRASLARAKEMGGCVRMMVGIESFGYSMFTAASPPRWASFNEAGAVFQAVDRYFQLAAQTGVKVIPDLIVGSGPGTTWHNLNLASAGNLDNPAVAASWVAAIGAFVTRYHGYSNILCYDLVNEGFSSAKAQTSTLKGNFALGYPVYEQFRRDAYAAVKAADPNARVMLTSGYADVINGFETLILDPAHPIADLVGYSSYNDAHPFTATASTAPGARQVSTATGQFVTPPSLSAGANLNGSKVYFAHANDFEAKGASLGQNFKFGVPYYVVNHTPSTGSFYLAAVPGGAPIIPTGMTSGTGSRNILVADASGNFIAAAEGIYRTIAMSQRLPFVATETGCTGYVVFLNPAMTDPDLGYRKAELNAPTILAYSALLTRYGYCAQLIWDEYPQSPCAMSSDGSQLNQAGRAVVAAGRRPRAGNPFDDLINRVYAAVKRVRTSLAIGSPKFTPDGDGWFAVERWAQFGSNAGGTTNANVRVDATADNATHVSGFSGDSRVIRDSFDVANKSRRIQAQTVGLHYSTDGGSSATSARVETSATGVRLSGDGNGGGSSAVQGTLLRGVYAGVTSTTAVGLGGNLAAGLNTAAATVSVPGAAPGALVHVTMPNFTLPSGLRLTGRITSANTLTIYLDAATAQTIGGQTLAFLVINI